MRMLILSLLIAATLAVNLQAQTTTPAKAAAKPRVTDEIAAQVEPTRIVVYKKVGDRELTLHLFEPTGHKPSDRRACFVAIHGGGWTSGEPRKQYSYTDHYAKLGLLGVSVQYRLLNKAKTVTPFECVKDGRSAIRYLKVHAAELGIDPEKIAVSGGSAGGHVAAGTALFDGIDEETDDLKVSPTPAALILYYPVIDTGPQGYGRSKTGADWKAISPVDHVRAGLPPTIVFHGTGDTVTPFVGAKRFDEEMKKAGNRCELVVNEGGIHGYFIFDRALYDDAVQRTDDFLRSVKLLETK